MGKFIVGFIVGWLIGLATGYMNNVIMAEKLRKKNEHVD